MKTAADVMTKHVADVDAQATVAEAIQIMRDRHVSSLLVRSGEGMRTWGFMTETDVIEKVVADGLNPSAVTVHQIMSKPVITVDEDMDIRYCARLFEKFGLSRAPVTNADKIVGIVSLTDLVLNGLCKNID